MTELTFAKSFLATLDSRPIKLQPDYVADPKTFELKGRYTLPRMPHAMRMRELDPTSTSNPGSTPALSITLKSLRNPPFSLSLTSQSPASSIFELKTAVAKHVGIPGGRVDGIRVLYKKKPCSDSKTVREVVGNDVSGGEVEFSVMIIGGVAATEAPSGNEGAATGLEAGDGPPSVAQGPTGDAVLATDDFWLDLKGYLIQRIRDEERADAVWRRFKGVWTDENSREG